eukprot:1683503-Rhodomonas_salina.1
MADVGQHTLTQMWLRSIEGVPEPDDTGESMEFALTIVIDCETATDLMYFCARLRSSLPPDYVPPTQ